MDIDAFTFLEIMRLIVQKKKKKRRLFKTKAKKKKSYDCLHFDNCIFYRSFLSPTYPVAGHQNRSF